VGRGGSRYQRREPGNQRGMRTESPVVSSVPNSERGNDGRNDEGYWCVFTSGGLYFSTFSKASAMSRVSTSSTASAPAWDR